MKQFYIKERDNPRLGTYYVAMGQMSKTTAKRYESDSLYGSNVMHGYATEAEYHSRLAELREWEKKSHDHQHNH